MSGETDFEAWLRAISPESFEDGGFIADDWLSWLNALFESSGPLPREAVEDRARLAMHALLADDGPWRRIADDVRATTGRDLVVRRGEPDVHRPNGLEEPDPTWLEIEVVLDGAWVCSFGHSHSLDPEEFVADLAEDLRESALDEEIWGGWPICPDHRTHPLAATVDDGRAAWRCPVGRVIAPIGTLSGKA